MPASRWLLRLAAQHVGQRQAAHGQPADKEEVAARHTVAVVLGRAGKRQHGVLQRESRPSCVGDVEPVASARADRL